MVRTKARAKILSCFPSSSGSSDSDSLVRMVRSRVEVLTELRVKQVPDNQVPCTPDGRWIDSKPFFITKTETVNDVFYHRDMSTCYKRYQEDAHPGPYDEAEFNSRFADLGMSTPPYPLKESFLNAREEDIDGAVRSAFQLGSEIQWRWPEPHERIYHRPADGFVPVWLEVLRSGWHPRWHVFFKHLCKYVYKISPMQITPNGIKWTTWFLAACNKSKIQPTFRLFHHLFTLVKSSVKPLFELRFRYAECGFGPGHTKPVMQQSSLKHWNRELILLKGVDLFYTPYVATEGVITEFDRPVLEGKALKQIYDFCNRLGSQWTRDTFMDFRKLHRHGCKSSFHNCESDMYDLLFIILNCCFNPDSV